MLRERCDHLSLPRGQPTSAWCDQCNHYSFNSLRPSSTIIGSDNGLSPSRRQAIIGTNAGILLIRPLGINFSEILVEIHIFSLKKMHIKWPSGKWRPFCPGLNVLTHWGRDKMAANFTTTFSNAFSRMKICIFRLLLHWSLFPVAPLTIFQNWFR